MTSTPPPDYVASIRLRVSAELAFRTIADLERQSWNSFTPKITPKTASTTGSVFEGDPSDVPLYPVDTPITIRVETLLPFPIIQRERITRWDVPHREIAWSQAVLPRWLLWTDRTQKVDEHEHDDGRGECDYVTTMVSGTTSGSPVTDWRLRLTRHGTARIPESRRSEVRWPRWSGSLWVIVSSWLWIVWPTTFRPSSNGDYSSTYDIGKKPYDP